MVSSAIPCTYLSFYTWTVPIAYRHVRCGKIVENKLVYPPTIPYPSDLSRLSFSLFLSFSRSLTLFATCRSIASDRRKIFRNFLSPDRATGDRPFRAIRTVSLLENVRRYFRFSLLLERS